MLMSAATGVGNAEAAAGAGFGVQAIQTAPSTDKRAEALKKYLEAKRLDQAGNYPGAVAAYKEGLALDPQSAELKVALGSLHLKNGNIIDAEAQARDAIKLAPENVDVHKLLARVYLAQTQVGSSLNKDKVRGAIKELEEAVKLSPTAKIEVGEQEVPAYAVIGELYMMLEDQDKALEALKRVSDADSTADRAHYRLAQLYFDKRKMREAALAARKAGDPHPAVYGPEALNKHFDAVLKVANEKLAYEQKGSQ